MKPWKKSWKFAAAIAILLLAALPSFADALRDQIDATLLGHVETTTEFTTRGEARLQLLDTVILIGKFDGQYLAGIDLGFLGDAKPDTSQRTGVNYTAGIKFHLAPIIRKKVTLAPEWDFLRALEINPRWSYDFTAHRGVLGIDLALAFALHPLQ